MCVCVCMHIPECICWCFFHLLISNLSYVLLYFCVFFLNLCLNVNLFFVCVFVCVFVFVFVLSFALHVNTVFGGLLSVYLSYLS